MSKRPRTAVKPPPMPTAEQVMANLAEWEEWGNKFSDLLIKQQQAYVTSQINEEIEYYSKETPAQRAERADKNDQWVMVAGASLDPVPFGEPLECTVGDHSVSCISVDGMITTQVKKYGTRNQKKAAHKDPRAKFRRLKGTRSVLICKDCWIDGEYKSLSGDWGVITDSFEKDKKAWHNSVITISIK